MYTLKIPSAEYALAALDASKKAGYMGAFLLLTRRLDANVEDELRAWWADLDDATGKELLVLITGLETDHNASLIRGDGVGFFTEGIVALSRFSKLGFKRRFEELAAVAKWQPEAPPEVASRVRLISARGIDEIRRALHIAEDQLPALLLRANEVDREILICLGTDSAPFSPVEIIRGIIKSIDDVPAKISNLESKNGLLEAEKIRASEQLEKQLKNERRYCSAISKRSGTVDEQPPLSIGHTPRSVLIDRKGNCIENLGRCKQRIQGIRVRISEIERQKDGISTELVTLKEQRQTMLLDGATSALNRLGFATVQNAASSNRVTFCHTAIEIGTDPSQEGAFDLFLSHSSRDKATVRAIAEQLKSRGLKVWYDEWQLALGQPWQPLQEEGLKASRATAVFIGRHGLGPWQNEEMQVALMKAIKTKRPVIPILLPGAPSHPDLPAFLEVRTWLDLRQGLTDESFKRLYLAIEGSVGVGK